MKKQEIIIETRKLLTNVPEMIKLEPGSIDWLDRFYFERLIKNIGSLNERKQKIVYYHFFEKMDIKEISKSLHLGSKLINKEIDDTISTLGRKVFGIEDEIVLNLFDFEEDTEEFDNKINHIVDSVVDSITKKYETI